MQRYETPIMEPIELEEQSIITLSIGDGDGNIVDNENWSSN